MYSESELIVSDNFVFLDRELELPITRYSGSKRKLIKLIWGHLEQRNLRFQNTLELFGGTGMFSYYAKSRGKEVFYNDIFKFNALIAQATIGNSFNPLELTEALNLLVKRDSKPYANHVSFHFKDIYYTEEENELIDVIVQNIDDLDSEKKKSAGYYILFQSCIIKRPYNLFHRRNLNLRTNFSGGSFGNKTTWERSFEELFIKFSNELSMVNFDNGKNCTIAHSSALNSNLTADLIYIDPPYFQATSHVSYHAKYHFLEGLSHYEKIPFSLNSKKANKEIGIGFCPEFENKNNFMVEFEQLVVKHHKSILVMSYRNNGIPTIPEMVNILKKYKDNVEVINLGNYNYALSRKNKVNEEILIIAT